MATKTTIGVDLSRWRMRDYIAFIKASNEGNFDAIFKKASEVVVSWEFDGVGAPSNHENFYELTPAQWAAVQGVLGEVIKNSFTEGN